MNVCSRRIWLTICLGLLLSPVHTLLAATASLDVMSFNVRYANDVDTLLGANGWNKVGAPRSALAIQSILNFGPDLLGVQEPYSWQVDNLRAGLPGYGFVGVGRNDGVAAGEFCGIFYRQDRFSVAASGTFWLSDTPAVPGTSFLAGGVPRIASWATLDDQVTGQRYFLLNTHWDNASSSARTKSGELIRDTIPTLAGDLPVLVLGDLNATQTSTGYRELRGLNAPSEFQLLDSYRQVHPTTLSNELTFHNYQGGTSGSRIDFILHSSDFTATAATIDRTSYNGRWPSDHYPVTASFQVMVVPEPSTMLLALFGLAGAALTRRSRRHHT